MLVLALATMPAAAHACEFHGGPWGLAFARMMHAGAAEPATPQDEAQASEAALSALRAQFLQRFNVKVDGEPATSAPSDPDTPAAPAVAPAP